MSGARKWIYLGAALLAGIIIFTLLHGEWRTLSLHLLMWQRDLHRGLTLAIMELAQAPSTTTWLSLMGLSFGYGIFHAAGPGHGKAVLSTYLASHGGAVKRALGLSFAASLMQGVTAIVMVMVLVHGLGWVTRRAMGGVAWVEQTSFMLVALLGLWLCWRALGQLRRAYAADPASVAPAPATAMAGNSAVPAAGFAPVSGASSASEAAPMYAFSPVAASVQPSNAVHTHVHDAHCGCGGTHHIEPSQALDWRTAGMTVLAIGMRPCTGAVLILGAAGLLGQFAVGITAVLAMSIGTGITVSALALLSLFAREWATRRLNRQQANTAWVHKLTGWAALTGGAVIVALGISLSVVGVTQPTDSPLFNSSPAARSGGPLG